MGIVASVLPIGYCLPSLSASLFGCCVCQGLSCIGNMTFGRSARLGFSIFFTLAIILAWIMRDFAQSLMEKIPWISLAEEHIDVSLDRWYGIQAVYRISMGNFAFFILMCILLIGVKYKHSFRSEYLQNGAWIIKGLIWILFNILPFFLPNSVTYVYAWMARIGSPVFILIQVIMLLDFALTLNQNWVLRAEEGEEYIYKFMFALSVVIYLGVIVVFGFLFHWFAVAASCALNITLITFSLIIIIGFTIISMLPYFQRGSLFASALVSGYCVYLQYSSLASEPQNYSCNGLGQRINTASNTSLAFGMLFSIIAVVYSAFRAGSDTVLFFNDKTEEISSPQNQAEKGIKIQTQDPNNSNNEKTTENFEEKIHDDEDNEKQKNNLELVDYNYSFFHVIFALASMYIAMLMTGWGVGKQEEQSSMMDVGWVSMWIKMATFWVTAALYSWIIIAPKILTERDFS